MEYPFATPLRNDRYVHFFGCGSCRSGDREPTTTFDLQPRRRKSTLRSSSPCPLSPQGCRVAEDHALCGTSHELDEALAAEETKQTPRQTVVPIGTLVVTVTADRVPAAADYVLDLPLAAPLVPHPLDAQAAGRSENRLTGVSPVPLRVLALALKSAARRRPPLSLEVLASRSKRSPRCAIGNARSKALVMV